MDILNISQDDNDSDTSQEDFEDDGLEDSWPDEGEPNQARFNKWARPDPAPMEPDLRFMVLDCDFGIVKNQEVNPALRPLLHAQLQGVEGEQSYVRLHGVTQAGNSLCCNVFNFHPYFYVIPIPVSGFTESHVPDFQARLSGAVAKKIKSQMKSVPYHDLADQSPPIMSVEILKTPEDELQIYDFFQNSKQGGSTGKGAARPNGNGQQIDAGKSVMLKICCRVPKFVWTASKILKSGLLKFPLSPETGVPFRYEVYEGNINHTIRFMTHLNLPGCSWVGIGNGRYFPREDDAKLSHAQLEIDVSYEALDLISQEIAVPPVRVLSFDIEVVTKPPSFPFPRNGAEPVIQIGNTLATWGDTRDPKPEPLKVVFTLKSCDEIPGTEIFSFEDEAELLNAWRQFLITTDPDILTGYNIKKFDLPYLIDRANRIDMKTKLPFFGRMKSVQSSIHPILNKHKKFNKYDEVTVNCSGRVILDMMLVMMRHNTKPLGQGRARSGEFTLGEVGRRYLGDTKEDVKYTQIYNLQEKGPATRKTLAQYCVQDAYLPYALMIKHVPDPKKDPDSDVLRYYIEQARATGLPLKYLLLKSIDYHTYFKRVRKAKNPAVTFGKPVPIGKKKQKPATVRQASFEGKTLASLAGSNNKKMKFW